MHAPRNPLTVAAAILLAAWAAGCGIFDQKKVPAPTVQVDTGNVALKLVHIAAPRVKSTDAAGKRQITEAVGIASSVVGLDAAIFGGEVIANDDAATTRDSVDAFASAAGIIAAKRFLILGDRERKGALPKDEVLRALDRRKLLPDRSGTYSDVPRPDVRIVVLDVASDGSVASDARKAFEKIIGEAKEKIIFVAADQPPLDMAVQELLRRDARVKIVLFRAAHADLIEKPGEPLSIATPPLDGPEPAMRLVEIDGRVCKVRLLAVPGGAVIEEKTANLRPDSSSK